MIVMMILAAALVAGIAAGAFALSKAAWSAGAVPEDDKLKEKRSEWESLASRYDASKGYDEKLADSEAYRLCKELLGAAKDGSAALEDGSGASLRMQARLPDQASFQAFKASEWLKENLDIDELRGLVALADATYALGGDLEQLADQACVAAHDSENDIEKAKCREMLEEAFRILSPALAIEYGCPPENGRTFRSQAVIPRDTLAGLAGMQLIRIEGDPRKDQSARRKALAADGFRCRRCGRSPLSGGRLTAVYDGNDGRDVALCENCAPSRAMRAE